MIDHSISNLKLLKAFGIAAHHAQSEVPYVAGDESLDMSVENEAFLNEVRPALDKLFKISNEALDECASNMIEQLDVRRQAGDQRGYRSVDVSSDIRLSLYRYVVDYDQATSTNCPRLEWRLSVSPVTVVCHGLNLDDAAEFETAAHDTWRAVRKLIIALDSTMHAWLEAVNEEQVSRMNELDAPGVYWPSPAQPQATHDDLALAIIRRTVERLVERAWKAPRSQDFVNMEEVDRGVKVSVSRAENVEGRFKIHLCVRDDAASLVLARTELSESFITSASSVSAWAWAMLREQLDTALAIALSINQINVDEE